MNLLVALALTSFTAAPVPKADPAKDAKAALQGEWKPVTVISKGVDETKKSNEWGRAVISGDTFTIRAEKKDVIVATITIDHNATPKTFDLKTLDEGRELVIKGIYKLEKDQLTLCFGIGGGDRPKEFKSEEDSDIRLVVLERVKK